MNEMEARTLLEVADVFYGPDEDEPKLAQTLNMNDVWGWAISWGEYVSDGQLVEVATLFRNYGWPGLLYWVSERNGRMGSKFEDNNRFIEFVRHEEKLRADVPGSSARAYQKLVYTLGSK